MTAECSECGRPIQKPYKKVCSAECSARRRRRASDESSRRHEKANPWKMKERKRRYREANPEKVRERERRYREANPEKRKEQGRERARRYREAHPDRGKESTRRYKEANPGKVREQAHRWRKANLEKDAEQSRRWAKANPEKVKEKSRRYERAKLKIDIQFKLRLSLRDRLRKAIKGSYKSGSAVRDLGCSIAELKIHLERQFDVNMNWDNYGKWWTVDHIKPLASFDLTDREQFLRAVHWTNLQPLEKLENIRKGKRILEPEQISALAA